MTQNTHYRRNAGAFKIQKPTNKRIKVLAFANVFLGTLLVLSCIISPYEAYSDFQYGIRGISCLITNKPLKPCVCRMSHTYRFFSPS